MSGEGSQVSTPGRTAGAAGAAGSGVGPAGGGLYLPPSMNLTMGGASANLTPMQQHPQGYFRHYTAAEHAAAQAAAAAAVAGRGPGPSAMQGMPTTMGMGSMFTPAAPSLGPGAAGVISPSAPLPLQHTPAPFSPPAVTTLPPPPPTPPTPPTQQPLPPSSPPSPIREKQPDYEKDWVLGACQKEMRRRADVAGTKGCFRYGDGESDVNKSISNVKKSHAVQQLLSHDNWKVSQGLDPDWKQAPQGTPDAKRMAMQAKAAAAAEEEEAKNKCRTSADSARLAFILFSDEVYTKILLSEQPPNDRNKRDLHALGVKDPEGVWDKVVDYFLDEDLKLGGISPGNPVSHAGCTAPGVERMWEVLQSLDYKAPVSK